MTHDRFGCWMEVVDFTIFFFVNEKSCACTSFLIVDHKWKKNKLCLVKRIALKVIFNVTHDSNFLLKSFRFPLVISIDCIQLFFCRLRQESDLLSRSSHWSQSDLQSSSSANNITENNSSESTSSSETLKWLGSMSDVSVSSHATNSSNISGSGKLTLYEMFYCFLLSLILDLRHFQKLRKKIDYLEKNPSGKENFKQKYIPPPYTK